MRDPSTILAESADLMVTMAHNFTTASDELERLEAAILQADAEFLRAAAKDRASGEPGLVQAILRLQRCAEHHAEVAKRVRRRIARAIYEASKSSGGE